MERENCCPEKTGQEHLEYMTEEIEELSQER